MKILHYNDEERSLHTYLAERGHQNVILSEREDPFARVSEERFDAAFVGLHPHGLQLFPGLRRMNPDCLVTLITADRNVKSILFNIFGGITRCDDVANGIVEATKQIESTPPITIRLTGTNENEAVEILEGAGFSAMTDMDEAVKRAVELV